jgi:four helix bundle protein
MTDQALHSYRELIVWQKAVDLVTDVYTITKAFPRDEIYGLTSQLRRSAVSIPNNIAEGQGRATKGEFVQFLCHARGSIFELETQIIIAVSLDYVEAESAQRLITRITEVARILNGLLTSLGVSSRKSIH